MRAAQWTVLTFVGAIGALLVLAPSTTGPEGTEDATAPDLGRLAPVMAPPPEETERARFVPEAGTVVDLAVEQGRMVILCREGWRYHSGGTSRGWFGDPSPGSPDWLDRPVAVALGEGKVYVLEAGRFLVSVWDTLGSRTGVLALPVGSTSAHRPTRLLLGPDNAPLVVVQQFNEDGTASWDIVAFDSRANPRTLLSLPNQQETMIFQEPILALRGRELLSMDPLNHDLSRVDAESKALSVVAQREDPPLWFVPQRHVQGYQQLQGRMSGPMAALSALPRTWPSVRDFTVREDGSLLLTVTATEDRLHVEHLSPVAVPLGRLNLDGFAQPLFLSKGRAFIADEGLDETVIHEFVF
jgi:hypothetical protein